MSELAVKPWRTVRAPRADRPQFNFSAQTRETPFLVQIRNTVADRPPTWAGLSASPPEPLQALWNGRGLSAPLWTVRQPTRATASSLERARTVRPYGADCPPAHQSLCKFSGTVADCPPLWCGLSAVTQSALKLVFFKPFQNAVSPHACN